MERFEQLRLSLHVDGLSKVSVDKRMDIMDMGYVIASKYNKLTTARFFYAPHDMRQSCVWKSFCSGLSQRSLSLTAYGVVVVKQFISLGKTVANYIHRYVSFGAGKLYNNTKAESPSLFSLEDQAQFSLRFYYYC
ncbi:hypothetical protein GmHk_05G013409 [Glycine max]|nr:hypothetical protein GmHk_05G013409 [Glycine max]